MDVKRFKDNIKADIKAEMKPRKLLRTAFVPQTKGLLTPLKEVLQVFVSLIAQIFVQAKLIPKDHPSAKGQIHGFGAIWLMIIDASANIKFKRENIYQIVIFYGIVGMLVFGVLDVVAFLMHVSLGHAHAAANNTASLFNETNASDNAPTWIGNMFAYSNNTTATGLATVLGPMLNIYNSAILALGTAFALYQIAHLFMESAHHGKFGGNKYNHMYAPLRLVLGIGLLVPTSTGYNSAEIIAITVAKWGSGLASNVWSQTLQSMAQSSTQMTSMPVSDVNTDLQQIIVDMTCAVADRSAQGNTAAWDFSAMSTDAGSAYVINFGKNNSDSYCGSLTIPKETVLGTTTLYQTFITNILPDAHNVADAIYKISGGGAQATPQDTTQNPLSATCQGTCISDWNTFVTKEDGYIQTADTTIGTAYIAKIGNPDFSTYTDWTTAGFLFLKISQQSGQLYQMQNAQLGIALPDADVMATFGTPPPNCDDFFMSFHQICKDYGKTIAAATSMAATDVNEGAADDGYSAVSFTPNSMGGTGGGGKLSGALQGPYAALSIGLLNLTCANNNAGCTSTSFGHSITGIIGLGNLLLNVSSMLMISGGLIGLTVAGATIGQILVGLGAVLFPLGVSLAVMLPLLPAARFLFGIFTWVLTLFEAMVAMPIVALVSMEFSGEGLIAHGKQGWFVLLQMLLRPVLMIFGLIGAFMVFDALSGFISQSVFGAFFNLPSNNAVSATTVSQAMQNMTRTSIFTSFLTTIGFLYFYCVTLYALANVCFQMINGIPDRILSTWVGTFRGGPDAADSDRAMGETSSGVSGGVSSFGSNALQGAQGARRDVISYQNEQRSLANEKRALAEAGTAGNIAADRHAEMMEGIRQIGGPGGSRPSMDDMHGDAIQMDKDRSAAAINDMNNMHGEALQMNADRSNNMNDMHGEALSENKQRDANSQQFYDSAHGEAIFEDKQRTANADANMNQLHGEGLEMNKTQPNRAPPPSAEEQQNIDKNRDNYGD